MKVAGRDVIKKFMRKHANARSSATAWLAEVEVAQWAGPADVKARFPSVDFLPGNRLVFNIGGNNYRVLVLVRYRNGVMLIEKMGTHAEYDSWKLK